MVMTPDFHPSDPGSIPLVGEIIYFYFFIHIFNLVPNSLTAGYYNFQHSVLSRGNRISHHSRSQDSLLSDFSVKDAFSSVDVMQKDDISLRQKTEWGLAVCILK